MKKTCRIVIAGPVASGKTTLLHALLERLGERASAHEEKPQDNPFITRYYREPERWSFHTQVSFLTLYLDDPTWCGDKTEFYFFDRGFAENLVLARYRMEEGDMTPEEYALLERLVAGVERLMPSIDKYIYLDCSVPLLVSRLKERGREYESELGEHYARKQKQLYDAWASGLPVEKTYIVHEDAGTDLNAVIRFLEE